MAAAIGGGFALAVRPVSAETIITDSNGLDVADVKIPSDAGEVPAFRAMPKGGKHLPVVLVVHEIFGVHEHIKDVCRRLAKRGYFAVAPNLFARQGDPSQMTEFKDIQAKVVSKVPDAQILSDLDATVAWVQSTKHADLGKLGITGFCWGGRVVWLYAAHTAANVALKAGVAWYGRLVGDKDALRPHHPLDIAASLKAPVLGLYGAEDHAIPVATVDQMKQALAAPGASPAARTSRFQVYPGAGHAFFADYRPSYKKEAAEDGWTRMLAWFKSHHVG